MTEIPSGKNTHVSQADGAPGSPSPTPTAPPGAVAAAEGEAHHYRVSLSWSGDGMGCGEAFVAKETFAIPIGGGKELGGCGKGANSEEMLLAAVGTCWIGTWAIFLKKLAVPYGDPRIVLTGSIGKDPAGGWRMTGMRIFARVPAALLAEYRPAIEKTVILAEKYCIISKVAKAAMPVEVEIEEM
jgi:organic hydroperoxide reductase OsmC/OhrA